MVPPKGIPGHRESFKSIPRAFDVAKAGPGHNGTLLLESPVSSPLVEVRHLRQHLGETVSLRGWVRNARTSKTRFVELRDGSGFVQCVVSGNDADETSYETAGRLTQECAISLTGLVQQHPKTGEPEILVKTLELLGDSVDFPITPKEHGTEFLMEHRHLWLPQHRKSHSGFL
jgi:asparaginyl-tRNA synthetase